MSDVTRLAAVREGLLSTNAQERRLCVRSAHTFVNGLSAAVTGSLSSAVAPCSAAAPTPASAATSRMAALESLLPLALARLSDPAEQDAVVLHGLVVLVSALTRMLRCAAPGTAAAAASAAAPEAAYLNPPGPEATAPTGTDPIATSDGTAAEVSCPLEADLSANSAAPTAAVSGGLPTAADTSPSDRWRGVVRASCTLLLGPAGMCCTERLLPTLDLCTSWLQVQQDGAVAAAAQSHQLWQAGSLSGVAGQLGGQEGPSGASSSQWVLPLAEHVAALVRHPALDTFSTPGGALRRTLDTPQLQAAAAAAHAFAAAALQLLRHLLPLLPSLQPPRVRPAPSHRAHTSGGGGGGDTRAEDPFGGAKAATSVSGRPAPHVLIEEVAAGDGGADATTSDLQLHTAQRQAALVCNVVRLCATYGGDCGTTASSVDRGGGATAHPASCKPPADDVGGEDGGDGGGGEGGTLWAPWSDCATHSASAALLDELALHVPPAAAVAAGEERLPSVSAAAAAVGAWQGALATAAPALVAELRGLVILKPQRAGVVEEPGSSAPSTAERALAARQLVWLVRALRRPLLSALVPALLPPVLAAVEDLAAGVAVHGLAALHHLATQALAADLQWQRELLIDVARRRVAGCDALLWPATAPMAVALLRALEGRDVRSPAYHLLVVDLLAEAERNAHKPQHRLVSLQVLPSLLEGLGLTAVRHLARLMPLLLEWVQAPDAATRLAALAALGVLIRHTWPRMPAHGATLWQHLAAAYARESSFALRRGNHDPAANTSSDISGAQEDAAGAGQAAAAAAASPQNNAVQAAILGVCELLVQCGGAGFGLAVAQAGSGAGKSPAGQGVDDAPMMQRAGGGKPCLAVAQPADGVAGLLLHVQGMLLAQG